MPDETSVEKRAEAGRSRRSSVLPTMAAAGEALGMAAHAAHEVE